MAKRRAAPKLIPVPSGTGETTTSNDKSPYTFQRDKIAKDIAVRELPWTQKQIAFIKLALDKNTKCLLVRGPAGSSKTLCAVYTALKLVSDRRVSDIVLVRSAVESSDSKLGFLPGTAEEKMSEYLVPFSDKFEELLAEADYNYLLKDDRIAGIPIGFMRGRHLAVKAIIVDECQNMTFNELLTVTTRVGNFSKLMLLGDPDQSDLSNGKRGSWLKFYDLFDNKESRDQGIFTWEFDASDILRSDLVRYIVTKVAEYRRGEMNQSV